MRRDGCPFRRISVRRAEPRLFGTLCAALPRPAGDGCRRARSPRSLRAAHRARGSLLADGGRHVVLLPWRRHVPEARPGRPHHDERFIREHTRIAAEAALSDAAISFRSGSRTARRLWGAGTRPAFAASAGDEARGAAGMMVGHGDDLHAVGGPVRHIPVLLAEVLEALSPVRARRSSTARSAPAATPRPFWRPALRSWPSIAIPMPSPWARPRDSSRAAS